MKVNFINKTYKGFYCVHCAVLVTFALIYLIAVLWWWFAIIGSSTADMSDLVLTVRKVYMTSLIVIPVFMVLLMALLDILPVTNITKNFVLKSRYAVWLYKTYGDKCELIMKGNNMIYGNSKNHVTLVTNVRQVDDIDEATLVVDGVRTTLFLPCNGVITLNTKEFAKYEEND